MGTHWIQASQHLRFRINSETLSINYAQNSPRFLQPLNRWHCIAKSSLILVCLKRGRCLAHCSHIPLTAKDIILFGGLQMFTFEW